MNSAQPLARLAARCAPLVLASLAAAAPQERIQLFVDLPGPGGALAALSETTGSALPSGFKLTGLTFLPIDFQGRNEVSALLPGRPRFQADVPGASRIELPVIGGFLYRYSRIVAGGGLHFGFLRVAPDGALTPLAEIPGTGLEGTGDPYLTRVAIAASGRTLLAGTRQAAGGDVVELDLVERTVVNRSPNLPPIEWKEGGLAFANGFAVAASARGLFRFELVQNAVVQRVALTQPLPAWYSGELVTSPNGEWIATTAGASETLAHVFVFGRTGAARRVNETAAHLSGAGHLPDALGGPFLAVSDGGAAAAWRVEGVTREAFVGKVDPPPGQAPVQVTSDAFFTDTLDEVVVVLAAQLNKFLVAVGAAGAPGEAIENADFFLVTLDASGVPQFENVTMTGDAQPPFLQTPELSPAFVRELPEAGGLLVWDEQSGGTGRLIKVLPDQPGVHVLMNDVKSTDFAVPVGGELALSVQRRFATSDPHQVLRVPRDLSTAPVVVTSVNADLEYLHPVARADGWLAFVVRPEFGADSVQRVNVHVGALESFPAGAGDYGDVLGLSPASSLLVSFRTGTGTTRFFAWPFESAQPLELATAPVNGSFVPGR